ncbi:rod shape-determining protein MreC [Novosphingobium sp.]|uniref:rod shape-determining protein MreC n=1 Tax=Novosphingobium sp. TaxID=1874826 RepID=UPI0025DB3470|nr:rod shape-determining protein MreC [Novosphingobium sp.]MCC6925661.1 rod shape-determining protein MreC [Novosphingobium sp.]
MAAPSNRRPGYSRRAQYGNFFGYVAAVAGLGLGALLLFFSLGNNDAGAGMRGAASDLTAPVANAAAGTRSEAQGFWATLSGYFTSGVRVARLEKEVAEARVKLAEQAALREENGRLKAMLGLTEGEQRPVVVTRLIGSTSSSSRRYAAIAAGTAQGVRVGMAVRSPLGLVGRVVEVGGSSARVLLITDTDSSIPVRRAVDGIQAYANGRGDGTIHIRLAVTGLNPLKKGDAIVTSGSGGLYRPNQAVAVVVQLTPDGAIARPLSDPALTEFVAVEPVYEEVAEATSAAQPGAATEQP